MIGRRKGPEREEILALRPVRLAEWSEKPVTGDDPPVSEEEIEEGSGGHPEEGSELASAEAAVPPPGDTSDPALPRVTIERPLPPVRGLRDLVQRISALTGVRRVRLDERGSFVWRMIDGERTVDEIARELAGEFGPEVEPADERVALLLRSLDRERFVELRDPAGEPVKLGRS